MKNLFAILITLMPICTGVVVGGPEIDVNPTDPSDTRGLVVLFPKEVAVTPGQKKLKFKIENRGVSDIYLVVSSGNQAGIKAISVPKGLLVKGFEVTWGPKKDEVWKIIRPFSRGGKAVTAEVVVDCGGEGKSLADLINGSGVVEIPLVYRVGENGDPVRKRLDVPIELKKAEQDGRGDGDKPSN